MRRPSMRAGERCCGGAVLPTTPLEQMSHIRWPHEMAERHASGHGRLGQCCDVRHRGDKSLALT